MARVLVVEDNRSIARLIDIILSGAGHSIETVNTGKLALDSISSEPPDLVLLDLELPDTDGFRVLESIREVETAAGVRVVAFTSHTEHDIVRDVGAAGFDAYIPKPVVPDEFVKQIEAILAR
jgi:DNA-binding response OmpR family regulator